MPEQINTALDKIPPIRKDIEIVPQFYRGELCYVIKDPVTRDYYRVRETEYIVLKCFQQGMDVEETRKEVKRLTGAEVDETEIYKFANQLQQSNLLKSKGMADVKRMVKAAAQRRKAKIRGFLSNYLFMTIPLWDPDRLLEKILPFLRFLFNPLFLVLWLVVAGSGMGIIVTNFSGLLADAFSVLSGWNLLILSCVIFSTKFIHEMGHALTCKHLGGHVRAIGPAFLVLQPCMFTDVTDAWLFPSKWDRIKVSLSGVMADLLMASVAAFVWVSSEPGLIKQISYTVMIACTVWTILFNANPLLRFDGYYILSDLLEIPNLRRRAEQYIGYLFDHYALGIDNPGPDVSGSDKRIYLIYGVARFFYRWIIILAIGFFLLSLFVPLGVFMLVSSFYGMVLMPIWRRGVQLQRQLQAGRVRFRLLLALALICALLAGLFLTPVDYKIQAPCVIVPQQMSIIRAPADGEVARVLVAEGQLVRGGEKLAEIQNPAMISRALKLRELLKLCETRMRAALAKNVADFEVQCNEKDKLVAELQQLEDKIARFTLVAPHKGVVVNLQRSEIGAFPPQHTRVQFPPADHEVDMSHFEGMQVAEGTGLLGIFRMEQPMLKAFVYERDVSFLSPGAPLTFKLVSQPDKLFRSRVESLTPVDVKTIENVGITLADIGYIPVKPGPHGEQQPLVTLYVAEARLQGERPELKWGFTGKAQIVYGQGPLGPYFANKVVRTIKLKLQRI